MLAFIVLLGACGDDSSDADTVGTGGPDAGTGDGDDGPGGEMDAGGDGDGPDGGDPQSGDTGPDGSDPRDGSTADAETPDASAPDPELYAGPCIHEKDLGNDGEIDERVTLGYDGADRVTLEERDSRDGSGAAGADGTADERTRTDYDDAGRVVRSRLDWDADDTVDLDTTFDAAGAKLSEVFDVLDDGTQLDRTEWTYHSDGRLDLIRRDRDGDGQFEERTTHMYDSGRLTRIEIDRDLGDAPIDESRVFTYDGDGNLLTEERLLGDPGTVVRRETWTHDGEGRPLSHTLDEDADDMADRVVTWTYAAGGTLESESVDEGATGMPVEVRTYDADGNLLTEEELEDGVLESRDVYMYVGGLLATHTHYADDSGDVVYMIEYDYDDGDRLLTEERDGDGDGSVDRITRHTYDSAGRLLSIEVDLNADGTTVVAVEMRMYDSAGNLLSIARDGDADGDVDDAETFTYACWTP